MNDKCSGGREKNSVRKQYKDPSNLNIRWIFNKRFGIKKDGPTWYQMIFDKFDFPPDARVLELGCGLGNLWTENKDRIPAGWEITLSDFSQQMLDKTRENVADIDYKFKFELIDADKIPYDDETYDAVVANHMLYFMPDVDRAIKEIARVIKPGGMLIASTSGRNYMRELKEVLEKSDLPVRKSYSDYSFSLENGEEFLKKYFSYVKLYKTKDEFMVDDAKLMADYVLSTNVDLTDKERQKVYDFFAEYFNEHKDLYISRETGFFVAVK